MAPILISLSSTKDFAYSNWLRLRSGNFGQRVHHAGYPVYPSQTFNTISAILLNENYRNLPWHCNIYRHESGETKCFTLDNFMEVVDVGAANASTVFVVEVFDGTAVKSLVGNRTARFTDEAQAKELNANLKIRFEDSDEPIFVNRGFLAFYSPVFRAMFENDFKEKTAEEIQIKDMKKGDFLAFLDCLCQPATLVSAETLEGILVVADRYESKLANELCKDFMLRHLGSYEDYKFHIELADRYDFKDLLQDILHTVPNSYLAKMLDYNWLRNFKPETMDAILNQAHEAFAEPLNIRMLREARRSRAVDEEEEAW